MKNLILTIGSIFFLISGLYTQTNSPWNRNGNSIINGDWLGTNNNEALLLKANNNLGIKIKPNGELMFKSLDLNSDNGPNGIVFTDGQGRIFRLNFSGNSTEYLLGNGTWGNLPSALLRFNSTGENVYLSTTSKFGIGNPNPQAALDVVGNTIFGGGLKLSSLAGSGSGPLLVDASGNVFKGLGAYGCVNGAPQWSWGGDFFTPLSVLGGSILEAEIGTCNNYEFIVKTNNVQHAWFKTDGTIGFGTNIGSNTFGPEYKFKAGVIRLQNTNTYGGPQIIFDYDNSSTPYGEWGIEYTKALTKQGLNFWKPFGSNNSGNNFLFLADDGTMGIGTDNPSTKLTIDSWNIDGLKILTDPNKNVIDVFNKTTQQTEFRVKSNGFVYAREINVMPPAIGFPDYVFAKEYKLIPLKELEAFIDKEKHLPNIPSASEVEKNGINLSELQVKQMEKIEELFLYVIDLKKENDELKAKVKHLETKIKQ